MNEYNSNVLAYIGDAYFELYIRNFLLNVCKLKTNDLHKNAIKYTSAMGQLKIIESIMDKLDEEELIIFKRGRNTQTSHKPKNVNIQTYHIATGFECLVGYLYLEKREERLEYLLSEGIKIIE